MTRLIGLLGIVCALTGCDRTDNSVARPAEPTSAAPPVVTSAGGAGPSEATTAAGAEHLVDRQRAPAPERLPPCNDPGFAFKLEGLTQDRVRARFGPPTLEESFQVQDRQGEFYVGIANTYPTTDPKNRNVPLQEWTWTSGDCILTVWFHNPKGTWLALDDVYWHKDTAF